jgi:hypothetical protein
MLADGPKRLFISRLKEPRQMLVPTMKPAAIQHPPPTNVPTIAEHQSVTAVDVDPVPHDHAGTQKSTPEALDARMIHRVWKR